MNGRRGRCVRVVHRAQPVEETVARNSVIVEDAVAPARRSVMSAASHRSLASAGPDSRQQPVDEAAAGDGGTAEPPAPVQQQPPPPNETPPAAAADNQMARMTISGRVGVVVVVTLLLTLITQAESHRDAPRFASASVSWPENFATSPLANLFTHMCVCHRAVTSISCR